MDIKKIYEQVSNAYQCVNDWVSEGRTPLIRLAFPNQDGVRNMNVIADLMTLRVELNSLAQICKYGIENINDAIGDYGITTMQELADYINSEDYNQIIANHIIKANGWTDLCGENDYDICTNGVIKVTLDENTGEAKVI